MTQIDRRNFIAGSAALIASAGCVSGASGSAFFASRNVPIGVQLYTLGQDAGADLDGLLNQLASIGYRSVETAGFPERSPEEFRAALDRAGLSAPSAHIRPQGGDGAFDGDLVKLVDQLQTVGATHAVMPIQYIPERVGWPKPGEDFGDYFRRAAAIMTADDWRFNADYLNQKGEIMQRFGIQVGYHNHNFEFAPRGDTNGMEILFENTDPSLVTFEVDIGWVAAAGLDPIDFLTRHSGRISLMHMKDVKASTQANFSLQMDPAEIGSGVLDWEELLPAAWAAGVRNYFVEQEPPFAMPRIEAVRISHDYLAGVKA